MKSSGLGKVVVAAAAVSAACALGASGRCVWIDELPLGGMDIGAMHVDPTPRTSVLALLRHKLVVESAVAGCQVSLDSEGDILEFSFASGDG